MTLDEIEIMGDPHLGRRFNEGVPLARRGEREETVWDDFKDDLNSIFPAVTTSHICLGDLFDRVDVGYMTVVRAVLIYGEAAVAHPEVDYFVIGGNHDQPRTADTIGSLELFKMLTMNIPNIHVVTSGDGVCIVNDTILLAPWHPVKTAEEMLEGVSKPIKYAFGHWDVETYGNETPNLIPTKRLAELGVEEAITGHVHKPDEFERDGIKVTIWGSLQPFTFAEDADSSLYVTMTLDELKAIDAADYRDKCIRVQLEPGQEIEDIPDCLQFRAVKLADNASENEARVDFDNFSAVGLFDEVCEEFDVHPDVRAELFERFNAA